MNNNFNGQPMGPQPMPNGMMGPMNNGGGIKFATDKVSLIGYAGAVLSIVSCFLPFAVAKGWGMESSANFISSNGELLDGVFVLIALIVFAVLVGLKKNKISLIPYAIAIIVYIMDITDFGDVGFGVKVGPGIGCYLIAIGFVIIGVHYFLYFKGNKANPVGGQPAFNQPAPMPMPSQPMPNGPQPMNNPQNPNNNNMM